MKKIFLLFLAILLVSFSGFSKNKRAVSKKTQKKIEKKEPSGYLKAIEFQNQKNQFKDKLKTQMNSSFFRTTCYNFGYEYACTLPGSCVEYEVCGEDFASVWAMHEYIDANLYQGDCTAYATP